jgi:integrase
VVARVPGVTIRFDEKRATKGQLPWGVFVDIRIDNKRYSPSRFFATEAEAVACYPVAAAEVAKLREEAEAEARLKAALDVPPLPKAAKGTTLFETLTERWLDEQVEDCNDPSTYRGYLGLLNNHLRPIMRAWPVTDDVMTTERLQHVLKVDLAEKGVPLPTRIACQRCLSVFFNWAMGALPPRQLTKNPVEKRGKYIRTKEEKKVKLKKAPNPMTRVQAEAFLKWQKEHYPQLYEWWAWLIDEGSRVGEVSALKWEHIDLDKGQAHIVEAFSPSQRWMERREAKAEGRAMDLPEPTAGEKDTKTHREDQYIDLSPRVVAVMTKLRARNREAWFAAGRPGNEPRHAYLTSKLTPRRPDKQVYESFRDGSNALALVGQTGKRFTIHCLRDTFATLSILEGKPLGWVSLMLGHEDEETTRTHYYKWVRLVEENLLGVAQKTGDDY